MQAQNRVYKVRHMFSPVFIVFKTRKVAKTYVYSAYLLCRNSCNAENSSLNGLFSAVLGLSKILRIRFAIFLNTLLGGKFY